MPDISGEQVSEVSGSRKPTRSLGNDA